MTKSDPRPKQCLSDLLAGKPIDVHDGMFESTIYLQELHSLIESVQPKLYESSSLGQMMQDMLSRSMPVYPGGFEGLELDDLFLSSGLNMDGFVQLHPALVFYDSQLRRLHEAVKEMDISNSPDANEYEMVAARSMSLMLKLHD